MVLLDHVLGDSVHFLHVFIPHDEDNVSQVLLVSTELGHDAVRDDACDTSFWTC